MPKTVFEVPMKLITYNVLFVVCNPGQQLNSSNTGCEVCPVNTWKSTYSLNPCNPCAANSITNGSVAQVTDTCGKHESMQAI